MEEQVGQLWHRLVSRAARREYPEAAVPLADVRSAVGIWFRAFGGDSGLRVEGATETRHGARRRWTERLAGTGTHVELAWRDEETLRLPTEIAWFETAELNRQLYLWLSALAADESIAPGDWLQQNTAKSAAVLKRLPGLEPVYHALVAAHISERQRRPAKQGAGLVREASLCAALRNPALAHAPLPAAPAAIEPVPLWLHPCPPDPPGTAPRRSDNSENGESDGSAPAKKVESKKRRRGERVDEPDGRDGLLAFRLESLFSRAEYVAVDRSTEENEDENADAAIDDLDRLSIASGGDRPAKRLRFDLDLPAEEHDDIRLGPGIRLPEWDYRRAAMLPDHCLIEPLLARDAAPVSLPRRLHAKSRRMHRLLEQVRPRRSWERGLVEGSEVDTDRVIAQRVDRLRGIDTGEARLFRELKANRRDLACLVLADLSMSTDTWIDQQQRIIDVIRDGLMLFCEALAVSRDRFALYGFSSRRREHVRMHVLKTFVEPYGDTVLGRIACIKPGYYTRMGAAIRHSADLLAGEPSTLKLLLILSDGKPNDLDRYEGRYGIEDTRHAIKETTRLGITPFCVTIDSEAPDYLPYLFGRSGYAIVRHVDALPTRLPLIYARLTQQGR